MKNTSNFKIGDRVKVVNLVEKDKEDFVDIGEIGTVVELSHPNFPYLACMVELDEYNKEENYNLKEYLKEVLDLDYHDEVFFETNSIGFLDEELELVKQ
ncbi:MAG TPA: hypothetical protein GXZ90_01900 [Clostridiales bacterium]|nr:hypothetical protein [Clostridiales bacterium]